MLTTLEIQLPEVQVETLARELWRMVNLYEHHLYTHEEDINVAISLGADIEGLKRTLDVLCGSMGRSLDSIVFDVTYDCCEGDQ